MVDMNLLAKSALDGYSNNFGGTQLSEVTAKTLVSVAIPARNKGQISKALTKAFKVDLPAIGTATISSNGKTTVLGLQPDQFFILLDQDNDAGVEYVARKLGDIGYYTEQSDSWAMLRISGANTRSVLERICMIDLHENTFPVGSVARTVMEHLGTIIYHQSEDSYLIMSIRSSAKTLLHTLEKSVHNVALKPA